MALADQNELSNKVFLRNLSPQADEFSVCNFLNPILAEQRLGPEEIIAIVFKNYENSANKYCEVQLGSSAGVTCVTGAQGRMFLGVPVAVCVREPTAQLATSLPPSDSLIPGQTFGFGLPGDTLTEIHRAAAHAAALAAQVGYVSLPELPSEFHQALISGELPVGSSEDPILHKTLHVEHFPSDWTEETVAENLAKLGSQFFQGRRFVAVATKIVSPVVPRMAESEFVALVEWDTPTQADLLLQLSGRQLEGLTTPLSILPAKACARHVEPTLLHALPIALTASSTAQQLIHVKGQEKIGRVQIAAQRLLTRLTDRLTRRKAALKKEERKKTDDRREDSSAMSADDDEKSQSPRRSPGRSSWSPPRRRLFGRSPVPHSQSKSPPRRSSPRRPPRRSFRSRSPPIRSPRQPRGRSPPLRRSSTRSKTPPVHRRSPVRGSISPARRSRSPVVRRSRSPVVRRSRSPVVRRSRSPVVRRSRSPVVRRSRSPVVRRSRSPVVRRSRSPVVRRSRSPVVRRSRSPVVRRSRSPVVRRSRSPVVRRSRSPVVRRSRSPVVRRSRSPVVRRSRSPVVRRSRSPVVRRSRSPTVKRSRSPDVRRSPGFRPRSSRRRSPGLSTSRRHSRSTGRASPPGRRPGRQASWSVTRRSPPVQQQRNKSPHRAASPVGALRRPLNDRRASPLMKRRRYEKNGSLSPSQKVGEDLRAVLEKSRTSQGLRSEAAWQEDYKLRELKEQARRALQR